MGTFTDQNSIQDFSNLLRSVTQRVSRVFIVVDALDECADSQVRSKLLKEIRSVQSYNRATKLFATSRYIPEITRIFDRDLSIEIRATDGDVRRYLENHMADLTSCVRRSQALQDTIVTEIIRAVDGMSVVEVASQIFAYSGRFLLAQLHLSSLSDKTTAKAIKRALAKVCQRGQRRWMTAYGEALNRIQAQKAGFRDPAKLALSWIVYAARQLSVLELQHALAIEEDSCELDEDNLPEMDEVLSACAGLVTVDEDSGIVRLVHYTTQGKCCRVLYQLLVVLDNLVRVVGVDFSRSY